LSNQDPVFYLTQALSICEEQLGPTHPRTASSLNSLALLYWNQGKYEQAEPLLNCAHVAQEPFPL